MAAEDKKSRLTSVVSIEVLVDEDWVGSMTPYRVRVKTPGSATLYRPMSADEVVDQVSHIAARATPTDPRKVRR